MQAETFDEFVKRQTARENAAAGKTVDWKNRRANWLSDLSGLYSSMEKYLRPYTESGAIRIERSRTQLTEEYLGTYEVDKLTFTIGQDKVVAKPIGTLLIGSRGRVDLSGVRKTLRIVYLEEGGPAMRIAIAGGGEAGGGEEVAQASRSMVRGRVDHAGWYIATKPPDATVIAFTEDSFRDAIMEVSSG